MYTLDQKLLDIINLNESATDDRKEPLILLDTINNRPDKSVDLQHEITLFERNYRSVLLVTTKDHLTVSQTQREAVVSSKLLKNRMVSSRPDRKIDPNVAFGDQRSARALGTAFFITPGENRMLVATAAHVVMGNGVPFADLRFIRNFALSANNNFSNAITVSLDDVFVPVADKPTDYYLSRMSSDWALLEVKPIDGGTISGPAIDQFMFVNSDPAIKMGDTLYSIGHGLGLPLKISPKGHITRLDPALPYFECNLSLLGGNSGSPIFSATTHHLVGIYIRGTKKFIYDRSVGAMVIKDLSNEQENQECQTLDFLKNNVTI